MDLKSGCWITEITRNEVLMTIMTTKPFCRTKLQDFLLSTGKQLKALKKHKMKFEAITTEAIETSDK
jgi:hypothetical protein